MTCGLSEAVMWRAFAGKDAGFDGLFYVGVKTTGVFCRPVCRAKLAKRENVEFFGTAGEAVGAGYRGCRMCRPLEGGRRPEIVETVVGRVERGEDVSDAGLKAEGIDAGTARRQFRRWFGMTVAEYARRRRVGGAIREIAGGESVVMAQVGAGFESGSGFREACMKMAGTTAAKVSGVKVLAMRWYETPVGRLVGVASEEGLLVLEFVEEGRAETQMRRVKVELGGAVMSPGENGHLEKLERELGEYFAGERRDFTVPIVLGGSAFEREVWEYLRTIPYGETRSYGEQAGRIGRRGAARAVGAANGRNRIAIVVPCHRVVGADGSLTGYGGGVERKRWLLELEVKAAGLWGRAEEQKGKARGRDARGTK